MKIINFQEKSTYRHDTKITRYKNYKKLSGSYYLRYMYTYVRQSDHRNGLLFAYVLYRSKINQQKHTSYLPR